MLNAKLRWLLFASWLLFGLGGVILWFWELQPFFFNLKTLTRIPDPFKVQKLYLPKFEHAVLDIPLSRQKEKIQIPILMFHYIKDIPSTSHDQLGYKLSYAPNDFERLLQFLYDHHIQTLTHRDLKQIIEWKKQMPERAVMLTFDDGHREHFHTVFPLLKKYKMKAVFFVIAWFADQDPLFLTRDEIKQLRDHGHEIGSHTLTHPNLASLSRAEAQFEILQSKKELEERLEIPIISFCYPIGRYNAYVLQQVQQYYLFARSTRSGTQFSLKDRWRMPTIRIFPTTTIDQLKKLWILDDENKVTQNP